ncbi:MAG: hypothetical protein ABSB35_35325 [Bryobacteraceae bacterium]
MAAVVFAVLLLALISYRMLHGAPSEALRSVAAPVVRPEAPSKPPIAHASVPDSEVPAPPPPSGSRPARVHKASPPTVRQAAAVAPPVPVIVNADVDVAPPTPVAAQEIVAPPVVVPEEAAPEVASAAPEAPPPPPASRKRNPIRAIGHFLHIGKRDVQPNAMNQP